MISVYTVIIIGTTYDTISPAPTDDSNCKEHKKLLRGQRNILATLVIATVIVLIVIIGLNSWFTGIHIHEEIIPKPQYLLLPVDSTFRLPVDSTKYGSIEFSLTDPHARTITITFILGGYINYYNSSDFTINDANCDLNTAKPITSTSSDCNIVRYWPAYDDIPDPEGYVNCESRIRNEDKTSFLVWKWFPFQVYNYNHSHKPILDFNIDSVDCNSPYYECTSLNNPLSVADILQDRNDGDRIVVMKFCTNDRIDAVDYSTVFHESYPKFVTPYNKYILSNVDHESVTVPLTDGDKHIDIVVTGSGTDPVEIQLNRRASVTRMLEDIRVYNGAIVVITFSIVLLLIHIGLAIAIVCSLKKYGRQ